MQDLQWHRRAVLAAMTALAARPTRLIAGGTSVASDPFALGVASGDPAADGFVLWTRLVGPSAQPLDDGAMPVRFEIAEDEGFARITRSGTMRAEPQQAHSVHVEVAGLRPGRPYWYRFHALGATSPVGRTATAPVRAERMRIALAACQHWELGWFGAYRDILAAQPDLILQVGDYIYEQSYPDQPTVRRFGAPEPRDLAGYRARYALYRTDRDLQEAHRLLPWVVTWDDHEVLNDYATLANREGLPPALFAARRAAAYQAYFEHMPIRPSLWRGAATPRLYRGVDWGDLVSLSVLDTRQYRSAPPCAAPNVARNVRLENCAERHLPGRSMLGMAQEDWLARRLAGETRPWSLIAQGVFFAPLALDARGESAFSDQWDGYTASRDRLLGRLSQPSVRNAAILSGDVHSFWVNDLAFPRSSPPVATEIVTSAFAAQSPPEGRFGDVQRNNPHIRFSDVKSRGYTLIDIDQHDLTASLRAVEISRRNGPVATIARAQRSAGSRVTQIETPS